MLSGVIFLSSGLYYTRCWRAAPRILELMLLLDISVFTFLALSPRAADDSLAGESRSEGVSMRNDFDGSWGQMGLEAIYPGRVGVRRKSSRMFDLSVFLGFGVLIGCHRTKPWRTPLISRISVCGRGLSYLVAIH